jgi:hypothetical protein
MPGDQFILYDNGAWSDDLGVMALAGDGEAFTFGNQVIQDLMREGAAQRIGWTMAINHNGRTAFSIPFELDSPTKR